MRERCASCHPVYAPGTMTFAMWEAKVEDMRGRFAARQLPWLTPLEERALFEYLRRHAAS